MLKRFVALFAILCLSVVVGAQAPDRSHPPQSGPPPTLRLPAIQKRTLSNRLPVWIVERHEVPVVHVNLIVLSGTGDDPAGKFGIASLTASLLTEGAGSRSALEVADAVDFLGADLVTNAGSDASAVRLNVPVARLGDALPIMADVVMRPTFPQDELNRIPRNQEGANFGFPYCHADGIPDPDIKRPNPCAGVIMPAALTGPRRPPCSFRARVNEYRMVCSGFSDAKGSWKTICTLSA